MSEGVVIAYLLGIVSGTLLTLVGLFALIEWVNKD